MPESTNEMYSNVAGELKKAESAPLNSRKIFSQIGVSFASRDELAATLPFSLNDVTAGSESELQAVVYGEKEDVDLPLLIEQSNFFANMMKRAAAGETPRKSVADLERFLSDNPSRVWENSWVRFPRRNLSRFAQDVLAKDLLADKKNPASGTRADSARFIFRDVLESCGIDLSECLDPSSHLDTPRKIFERRIRYWECRPMPSDTDAVVSPADARVLYGRFIWLF